MDRSGLSSRKDKSESHNQSSVLSYSADDDNTNFTSSDNLLLTSPHSQRLFEALEEEDYSEIHSSSSDHAPTFFANNDDVDSHDNENKISSQIDARKGLNDFQQYLAEVAGESLTYYGDDDDSSLMISNSAKEQSNNSIERLLGISPQGKPDSAGKYNYKPLTPAVTTKHWSPMKGDSIIENEDNGYPVSNKGFLKEIVPTTNLLSGENLIESQSINSQSVQDNQSSDDELLVSNHDAQPNTVRSSDSYSESKSFQPVSDSSHKSNNSTHELSTTLDYNNEMQKLAEIEYEIFSHSKVLNENKDLDSDSKSSQKESNSVSLNNVSQNRKQSEQIGNSSSATTQIDQNMNLATPILEKADHNSNKQLSLPLSLHSPELGSHTKDFTSSALPIDSIPSTPLKVIHSKENKQQETDKPVTTSTEKSKIMKLPSGSISPFSPIGRRIRNNNTPLSSQNLLSPSIGSKEPITPKTESEIFSTDNSQTDQNVQWSLIPCRKVSIVAHVTYPYSKDDESRSINVQPDATPVSKNFQSAENEFESALCLYPFINSNQPSSNSISSNATSMLSPLRTPIATTSSQMTPKSMQSSLTQNSSLNAAKIINATGRELVMVNPKAFGSLIPSELTYEAARIVSEARHIASEDWVRFFKFDDIFWPTGGSDHQRGYTENCIVDICTAIVKDALNDRKNVAVFGHGGHNGIRNYRSEFLFGTEVNEMNKSRRDSILENDDNFDRTNLVLNELGVLGVIASFLLKNPRNSLRLQISMLEIVEDDVLLDLLAKNADNNNLKIRHPDGKGAIVENLTEVVLHDLDCLHDCIRKSFHSTSVKRARTKEGGRGHIISTIKLYDNDMDNLVASESCTLIQVVDLACAESDKSTKNSGIKISPGLLKIQERRIASIRKSLSGLRGILRGFIVNELQKNSQTLSYRECTLTKLIQRTLDTPDSRAIIVASVCPKKESYGMTSQTLNYINRLLVRPGTTAQSPFREGSSKSKRTPGNMDEFDGKTNQPHSVTFNPLSPENHSLNSSMISESIRSRFSHTNQKKGEREWLKSLVSDPRQRLASLSSASIKDSNGLVLPISPRPPKEITTPNLETDHNQLEEVRNKDEDTTKDEGTFDSVLEQLDALETASKISDGDSFSTIHKGKDITINDDLFFERIDRLPNKSFYTNDELTDIADTNSMRSFEVTSISLGGDKVLLTELHHIKSHVTLLQQQLIETTKQKEIMEVETKKLRQMNERDSQIISATRENVFDLESKLQQQSAQILNFADEKKLLADSLNIEIESKMILERHIQKMKEEIVITENAKQEAEEKLKVANESYVVELKNQEKLLLQNHKDLECLQQEKKSNQKQLEAELHTVNESNKALSSKLLTDIQKLESELYIARDERQHAQDNYRISNETNIKALKKQELLVSELQHQLEGLQREKERSKDKLERELESERVVKKALSDKLDSLENELLNTKKIQETAKLEMETKATLTESELVMLKEKCKSIDLEKFAQQNELSRLKEEIKELQENQCLAEEEKKSIKSGYEIKVNELLANIDQLKFQAKQDAASASCLKDMNEKLSIDLSENKEQIERLKSSLEQTGEHEQELELENDLIRSDLKSLKESNEILEKDLTIEKDRFLLLEKGLSTKLNEANDRIKILNENLSQKRVLEESWKNTNISLCTEIENLKAILLQKGEDNKHLEFEKTMLLQKSKQDVEHMTSLQSKLNNFEGEILQCNKSKNLAEEKLIISRNREEILKDDHDKFVAESQSQIKTLTEEKKTAEEQFQSQLEKENEYKYRLSHQLKLTNEKLECMEKEIIVATNEKLKAEDILKASNVKNAKKIENQEMLKTNLEHKLECLQLESEREQTHLELQLKTERELKSVLSKEFKFIQDENHRLKSDLRDQRETQDKNKEVFKTKEMLLSELKQQLERVQQEREKSQEDLENQLETERKVNRALSEKYNSVKVDLDNFKHENILAKKLNQQIERTSKEAIDNKTELLNKQQLRINQLQQELESLQLEKSNSQVQLKEELESEHESASLSGKIASMGEEINRLKNLVITLQSANKRSEQILIQSTESKNEEVKNQEELLLQMHGELENLRSEKNRIQSELENNLYSERELSGQLSKQNEILKNDIQKLEDEIVKTKSTKQIPLGNTKALKENDERISKHQKLLVSELQHQLEGLQREKERSKDKLERELESERVVKKALSDKLDSLENELLNTKKIQETAKLEMETKATLTESELVMLKEKCKSIDLEKFAQQNELSRLKEEIKELQENQCLAEEEKKSIKSGYEIKVNELLSKIADLEKKHVLQAPNKNSSDNQFTCSSDKRDDSLYRTNMANSLQDEVNLMKNELLNIFGKNLVVEAEVLKLNEKIKTNSSPLTMVDFFIAVSILISTVSNLQMKSYFDSPLGKTRETNFSSFREQIKSWLLCHSCFFDSLKSENSFLKDQYRKMFDLFGISGDDYEDKSHIKCTHFDFEPTLNSTGLKKIPFRFDLLNKKVEKELVEKKLLIDELKQLHEVAIEAQYGKDIAEDELQVMKEQYDDLIEQSSQLKSKNDELMVENQSLKNDLLLVETDTNDSFSKLILYGKVHKSNVDGKSNLGLESSGIQRELKVLNNYVRGLIKATEEEFTIKSLAIDRLQLQKDLMSLNNNSDDEDFITHELKTNNALIGAFCSYYSSQSRDITNSDRNGIKTINYSSFHSQQTLIHLHSLKESFMQCLDRVQEGYHSKVDDFNSLSKSNVEKKFNELIQQLNNEISARIEIEENLVKLRKEHSLLSSDFCALSAAHKASEEVIINLRNSISRSENEVNRLVLEKQQMVQKFESEEANLKGILDEYQFQLAENVNENKSILSSKLKLEVELENMRKKTQEIELSFQHSLMQKDMKLAEVEHHLTEKESQIQNNLSEMRAKVDSYKNKLHSAQEKINEIKAKSQNQMTNLKNEIQTLTEEKKSKNKEYLVLQKEKEKIKKSLDDKRENKKYDYETLEQTNNELRTKYSLLTDEFKALELKNKALKESIRECDSVTEKMKKEMNELKLVTDTAINRMERKKRDAEKTYKENMKKEQMESQKRLQSLEDTIKALNEQIIFFQQRKRSGKRSEQKSAHRELSSGESKNWINDEQFSSSQKYESSLNEFGENKSVECNDELSKIKYSLHTERALRLKAEEITAALAARARAGFEIRNKEIYDLKQTLLQLGHGSLANLDITKEMNSDEKDDSNHVNDNVESLKKERDDARRVARKYQEVAGNLHRQLMVVDHHLKRTPKKK